MKFTDDLRRECYMEAWMMLSNGDKRHIYTAISAHLKSIGIIMSFKRVPKYFPEIKAVIPIQHRDKDGKLLEEEERREIRVKVLDKIIQSMINDNKEK